MVAGTNLDKCEIRQTANVTEDVYDYAGTAQSNDVVRAKYEAGLRACVNSDQWCVDTGWDWQTLPASGQAGTDSQVHNAENTLVITDNPRWRKVARSSTTRRFKIEVRRKSDQTILKTHDWSYTWTNWAHARVPNQPYCGAHIDIGRFSATTGVDLSGLNP